MVLIADLLNQSSDTSQQASSQHSIVPMSFSQKENINLAFSAAVTTIIKSVNFSRLQRAAIERSRNDPKVE